MSEKKSILFLAPYPINKAPSQRLKYEQYYPYFESAGFRLTTHSFVSEAFWRVIYKPGNLFLKVWHTVVGYAKRVGVLFKLRQYDIVYIHLWVTPLGPPIFEWLVCKLSKRIIYDIDDLVYLGETSKSNLFIKWLKGRKKPLFLMKKADHVIVCTPKLENFAKQFNKSVTDISSTIDTDSYIPTNRYSNNHKIVIGWSGSHSTSKYLYLLEKVLKELRLNHDFKLLVIGDQNFDIEGLEIEARAWSAEEEVSQLQRIDIGLYPLPNEEWVYGKSGLKALQYMALGIPTVATAIGANFRIIENEVSGFLVDNEDQWFVRLDQLIKDPNLRECIGLRGRTTVETQYSLKSTAQTYLNIINRISN